jgi:hypothetical protein
VNKLENLMIEFCYAEFRYFDVPKENHLERDVEMV